MSDRLDSQPVTPESFRRIREVFESALEHPSEERQLFVEGACAGDTLLIQEVKRMLAAEDQSDRLLDAAEPASTRARTSECPSCKAQIAVSHRFCPFCGTPAESVSRAEGRFRAGALFANRFRIVGLIGRGGMGEIYRAHDLELDQTVALKFLTAVRFDDRARSRLRNEVRLARQVAHSNVCRVYDIGEAQGELYLSMEYVDGEDLAALLRRIGKLPTDKAVEIALKLCAGLAAAHAKGMLHRDLKPANIMLDSSGEVRIMDFGLAAISDDLRGTQASEGTPYYMAPEQLAGEKVSAQSDIYALGLVFYEMLTGKPPFTGNTPAELRRLREESRITPPSMFVSNLEPPVERAILRCLDPDPKMRPASALAVAALLPGGDPLARALAAGETPSPEVVAAAGSTEPVRPAVAIILLAGIAAGVAALCVIAPKVQLLSWLSVEKPPEVLIARARDIANLLGYKERPVDWAWGFRFEENYFGHMQSKVSDESQWRKAFSLPPPPLSLWYRQSPIPIRTTRGRIPPGHLIERVLPDDSLGAAGMIAVDMDLEGRLLRFSAASPSADPSTVPADQARVPDWSPLFAAARLDPTALKPTTPQSTPRVPTDTLASWTGSYNDRPDINLRIEAASFRGRIAFFEIVAPWTEAGSLPADSSSPPPLLILLVNLAFMLATAFFAYVNCKTGRADISGAARVGLFLSVLVLMLWALASHHPSASLALEGLMDSGVRLAFSEGARMFVLYLALEPWGRRLWPRSMITWSRVLTGQWRDPLVGRDVLIGLLVSAGFCLLLRLREFDIIRLGGPPGAFSGIPNTENYFLYHLMGPFASMTGMLHAVMTGFGGALIVSGWLLIGGALLRNKWVPGALFVLLNPHLWPFHAHWTTALLGLLASLLVVWTIYRFGVFVFGVTQCAVSLMTAILTIDFTMWYGASSVAAIIVVSGFALLGFRLSLLGRPLWNITNPAAIAR
jgi:predicted Ser/Thr protein kinase